MWNNLIFFFHINFFQSISTQLTRFVFIKFHICFFFFSFFRFFFFSRIIIECYANVHCVHIPNRRPTLCKYFFEMMEMQLNVCICKRSVVLHVPFTHVHLFAIENGLETAIVLSYFSLSLSRSKQLVEYKLYTLSLGR